MNEDPKTRTFISDGEFVPKGQYLVTEWPDGTAEIAFRPASSWVWSPPVAEATL